MKKGRTTLFEEYDIKKISITLGIIILILGIYFLYPIEKKTIAFPAEITISEQNRFIDIKNVEEKKSILNFGGVSAGYKVEKYINLQMNENAPPSDISFKTEGNIKNFILINQENSDKNIKHMVITSPERIKVSAIAPKGTEPGEYTGTLKITYYKTLFRKTINYFY